MVITGLTEIDNQSAEIYITEKYEITRADFGINQDNGFIDKVWINEDGTLSAICSSWVGRALTNTLKAKDKIVEISVNTPFFSDEDTSTLVMKLMYEKYGELSFLHDMLERKHKGVTHTFTYALTSTRREEVIKFHPALLIV